MKSLYLDVCALCRPYDDQSYLRIRLETDAVFLILKRIESGLYRAVISPVHYKEVAAITDMGERVEVENLLGKLDKKTGFDMAKARIRAEELARSGFGIADAAHLAFAEQSTEVFISCDDRLLKRAKRIKLHIPALSPLEFIASEEP